MFTGGGAKGEWRSWKFSEVAYRRGDLASFVLGVVSLWPMVAIACLVAVTLVTCDRRGLAALWVLLANEAVNLALKELAQEPRPFHEWDTSEIGHGMPSRHAQTSFAFATVVLFFFGRRLSGMKRLARAAIFVLARLRLRQGWLYNAFILAFNLVGQLTTPRAWALFAVAGAVAVGRVVNGYHTPAQVAVGAGVGVAFPLLLSCTPLPRRLATLSLPALQLAHSILR